MSKPSKSSRQWLDRHFKDEYVKKAQQEGYRSRAAFKLLEIQERDKLLKPGQTVVDLGAAPGGWSQIAKQLVGTKGNVVALDILEMEPLPFKIEEQPAFVVYRDPDFHWTREDKANLKKPAA